MTLRGARSGPGCPSTLHRGGPFTTGLTDVRTVRRIQCLVLSLFPASCPCPIGLMGYSKILCVVRSSAPFFVCNDFSELQQTALGQRFISHPFPFYAYKYILISMHAQSCLTLCDPMDYSLPGSFVRRFPQARTLE